MSIDITEDYTGLDYSVAAEGVKEIEGFVRVFDCVFSDASDALAARPKLIKEHADIPKMWDNYPDNEWVYVSNVNVQPGNGPTHFKAIITYVSTPDPLNEVADITWTFANSNEPVDRDIYGRPLVNSAGESFDPPMTKDFNDLILHIETNEATFDPLLAYEFKGAVNGDMFFGFGPGRAKCIQYSGVKTRAAALTYWRVTREFQFRRQTAVQGASDVGWKRRILDEGFRELKEIEGEMKLANITDDETGMAVSQPVPLDGTGKKLALSDTPLSDKITVENTGDAVFLHYDMYEQKPFSQLGLG